jgi:hypothetical protein
MPDPPEDYLLILRALPDTVPGVIRLRAALKRFLRAYGLRCIRVEKVGAKPSEKAEERP